MKNQEIKYRSRTLNVNYQPTKDPDFKTNKKVKVQAPQFTECTYDVGYQVLKELGSGAYSVYMALLSYRNTTTNDCYPSIERIHEDFNIAVRTIKNNLDKLYEAGYIDINSGHKNIANNYYFPKEYWYSAWNDDFRQHKAERRKNGISEERETKKDKQIEQLQEQSKEKDKTIELLKRQLERFTAPIDNSYENDSQEESW